MRGFLPGTVTVLSSVNRLWSSPENENDTEAAREAKRSGRRAEMIFMTTVMMRLCGGEFRCEQGALSKLFDLADRQMLLPLEISR